jgi:hypothetical protein
MAITDNEVATLREIEVDGGGAFKVKVVRGDNGREAVLLAWESPGGPPRYVVWRGYAVRPLIEGLLLFMARDNEVERKFAYIARELGLELPPPVAKPAIRPKREVPAAERKAFPWRK